MPGSDIDFMRMAVRLARRGYGTTSPNPMVGAVIVRRGRVLGRGWHRRAGEPHAEVEALADARRRGHNPAGATLYVTLEPCSTHGRTPPCTDAILAARLRRVVAGAIDPNPRHSGRGFQLLHRAGVTVVPGILAEECLRLNEAFNHWIVERTPFVTVKAAMTLDGKIATASGESKWITGERARAFGMKLRQGADAILVGINTILADNPNLTVRNGKTGAPFQPKKLRRIVLDTRARTPVSANVVSDAQAALTTIVVGRSAAKARVEALARRVQVWRAPECDGSIDLAWLLGKLGAMQVASLLVEGGGEVNASFLFGGLAHRVAFFYAPKILGGRDSRPGVGGVGAVSLKQTLELENVEWRRLGEDLLLTAAVRRGM